MLTRPRLLALLVGIAVLVPRLLFLDAFIIQDEWLWLTRAHAYAHAVTEGQWETLHQSPPFSLHPGAPLLALTSPLVSLYAQMQALTEPFEAWPSDEQRGAAMFVRVGLGVVTSALLVALFSVLLHTRLFASRPLWAAASVIALGWEPWVLGMSRAVHLDALLSLFLLLAVVLAAVAREHTGWRFAALSGSAWALAFMTKSPAVFFLPIVLLPFFLRPPRFWKTLPRDLGAWALAAIATAIAIWPPMWFHPLLRLREILSQMYSHVEVPEIYVWPGSHLPLFLTLLSAVTFVGLVLYVLLRAWSAVRRENQWKFLVTDLALAGGALFGVLLLIAGGDHARKDLPTITFFSLPGAVGWLTILERFRALPWVSVTALLALQAALTFPWFPHLPSFHNLLLDTEGKRLLVDIGNGTRLVAEHFNTRPPVVFATNLPGLIQPYLSEDRRGNVRRLPKSGNLAELGADVQYLVVPESFPARVLFDRGAAELLRQLEHQQPEITLRVRDVPLFSIVRLR